MRDATTEGVDVRPNGPIVICIAGLLAGFFPPMWSAWLVGVGLCYLMTLSGVYWFIGLASGLGLGWFVMDSAWLTRWVLTILVCSVAFMATGSHRN